MINVGTFVIIGTVKKIRKPKPWKHPQPITKSQLMQLREEFWDTAPHYGGRKGSFLYLSCTATHISVSGHFLTHTSNLFQN